MEPLPTQTPLTLALSRKRESGNYFDASSSESSPMNRVTAEIDLTALNHNYQRVKHYAPQAKVVAMVKANAYGHGLLPLAKALPQADILGVARPEEAFALRAGGAQQPILLMSGFVDANELIEFAHAEFAAVVHTFEQIHLLETTLLPKPMTIWLKIDTGMHRLGFTSPQVAEAQFRLLQCASVQKPFVWLTHFASAYALNDTQKTVKQWEQFQQLSPPSAVTSLANSAAIIGWPQTQGDYVRPGIMLYGVSPFNDLPARDFGLLPVMTLRSQLIAIHDYEQGEAIGYGGNWVCPKRTRIGVVAIGYGDGYPRHARNGTPVLLNGVRCPLVGRVSMDFISVDLSFCSQAVLGDVVTLWGQGLPVEEVAACADTIPYELLCHVTSRVKFLYLS